MTVLVITNKRDGSADDVIRHIEALGGSVFRLNAEELCETVAVRCDVDADSFSGSFRTASRSISFEQISSVFCRRATPPRLESIVPRTVENFIAREQEAYLTWLWTALRWKFWLNHPLQVRLAESKIDQLRIAHTFGLRVPRTIITNDGRELREFYASLNGHVINKVLSAALLTVEGTTHTVYTHPVTADDIEAVAASEVVPCLFQENVAKAFELRVTVVGEQVFAAAIDSQSSDRTRDDWRRYDFSRTTYQPFELPPSVKEGCLAMLRHYGLGYGAFDLAVTPDGDYVFFEVNPNGQWLWVERLTQLPISKAIATRLVTCQMPSDV